MPVAAEEADSEVQSSLFSHAESSNPHASLLSSCTPFGSSLLPGARSARAGILSDVHLRCVRKQRQLPSRPWQRLRKHAKMCRVRHKVEVSVLICKRSASLSPQAAQERSSGGGLPEF